MEEKEKDKGVKKRRSEERGFLREPAKDELAERAVLGGMIIEPSLIARAHLEGLKEKDFFYEEHRKLFALLSDMYERRGEDWDDVVFFADLERNGIEFPPALFYAIAEDGAIGGVWEEALRRVRELSILREADDVALKFILQAKNLQDLQIAKESLETLIDGLKREERGLREIVSEEIERIKRAKESSQLLRGVGTGFFDLDQKLLGFEGGQLVIVGARPGMGKSSFMLSMALSMAKTHAVGIFSLEMSAGQLVQRALSILSGVPLQNVRSGFINDEDFQKIVDAGLYLIKLKLSIDDSPVQSVMEIKAKAKWNGHEVVFIDYLQLIRTDKRNTRQEEVAEISMSLKAMAKQLNIPVIALAQLNRGTEVRSNKRPTLADLRESGQIEQDADVIIFLHRPEYYSRGKKGKDEGDENLIGRAEVIIAKNRQGPTGTVELRFDKDTTGFYPRDAMASGFDGDSVVDEGEEFDIDF